MGFFSVIHRGPFQKYLGKQYICPPHFEAQLQPNSGGNKRSGSGRRLSQPCVFLGSRGMGAA